MKMIALAKTLIKNINNNVALTKTLTAMIKTIAEEGGGVILNRRVSQPRATAWGCSQGVVQVVTHARMCDNQPWSHTKLLLLRL